MIFFFLHPHASNPGMRAEEHQLVELHEAPHNTSEGSEFLDDAIHLEDVPPIQTEESVAAGSPDNLL